jgi:hypothetical protein
MQSASDTFPAGAPSWATNFKGSPKKAWNGNIDGQKKANGEPSMSFKENYDLDHYNPRFAPEAFKRNLKPAAKLIPGFATEPFKRMRDLGDGDNQPIFTNGTSDSSPKAKGNRYATMGRGLNEPEDDDGGGRGGGGDQINHGSLRSGSEERMDRVEEKKEYREKKQVTQIAYDPFGGGGDQGAPDYWRKSRREDESNFVPMGEESIPRFQSICTEGAKCTADDPSNFGKGRDYRDDFNRGQPATVVAAWRIENHNRWPTYAAGRQEVARFCQVCELPIEPVRSALKSATNELIAALHGEDVLSENANEVYLLHSTGSIPLPKIVDTGFTEHFAGLYFAAYGDGTYFAEDIAKTDQYAVCDKSWEADDLPEEMKALQHKLYGDLDQHPGNVFYMLLTRVVLGRQVQTDLDHPEENTQPKVYAMGGTNWRELAEIPGSNPGRPYQSLLGDKENARFREVVIFRPGAQCYPEYLVAYHRGGGKADELT